MPPTPKKPLLAPVPLVAVAGWILPGAGYWLIGQRSRALTVGISILILFALGMLIGGIRVVEAPPGYSLPMILQRPWYIGQILAGPVTLLCNTLASNWTASGAPYSHARVYEIGTLYTAIAGMLNLMAIIDAAYRASNEGNR